MQAPPVFSQVPQMPPRKQTPWAIVLALIVAGVIVAGALIVVFFSLVSKIARAEPPVRAGYGHPVLLKKLDGMRAQYEFPEVPMRMELPGKPELVKFRWRSLSGISGWIGYRTYSKLATFTLSGTWYRDPSKMDVDSAIKRLLDSYQSNKSYEDFKGKIYPTKIGSLDGREIRASYRYRNVSRALRLYLWKDGDHSFYLSMHAYWNNRDEGAREQDEILKSIEYR